MTLLIVLVLAAERRAASGAVPGDVNGDGRIDDLDPAVLSARVFDASLAGAPGADTNGDGLISAADFTGIVYGRAGVSIPPSYTPRPATFTPTPTRTPTPTATATVISIACVPRALAPGTISDALSPGDCPASDTGRLSDVYNVTANPGQAISIELTATNFAPLILVNDVGVYFGSASGTTSIEFLATTLRPYEVVVTSSAPGAMTGPYSLKISVRNCPASNARTVVPTSGGVRINATFLDTDCPDPVAPDSPAHRYSFTAQAGTSISIAMQTNPASFDVPDPFLTIYGPTPSGSFTGIKLADDDATGGFIDNGTTNALISFYAIETGTYTVVASGGLGPYSIIFSLPPCPAMNGPDLSSPAEVTGTLTDTSCPAPLPLPDALRTDLGTRADVWSISATAGDVISAKLTAVDFFDAQLYLLGPDHTLLTSDDNGSEDGGLDAQLAFMADRSGTYTIIAASNDPLVDEGDGVPTFGYTLDLQRCPAVLLTVDQSFNGTFGDNDCHGTGGTSVVSYAFDGTAGQFVTVTMVADESSGLDPRLVLSDPNGGRIANDDDPFVDTSDSRVSRLLPQTGRYFVTASSDPDVGLIPADYVLTAQHCRTIPVTGSTANGNFRDDDCSVGTSDAPGGKLNVFTLSAGASQMLTIMPPANGCAFAVTADPLQGPGLTCLTDYFLLPAIGSGTAAVIVAANDPSTRGAFSFPITACPAQLLNFNSGSTGGLFVGNECRDVTGLPGEFFFFRAPASLTNFTGQVSGTLVSDFSGASVLTDNSGTIPVDGSIGEDASDLISFGSDLVFGLAVRSASSSARGAYTVEIDPPIYYQ
ncbi:MAG TPA: pre-peptidase C-terminal domain-containing protein [Candidatus Kryptonia bacterium]|nr:pre-peptidase C-terminal domain-containing protein [Candidatus Kryptonia bacterium]